MRLAFMVALTVGSLLLSGCSSMGGEDKFSNTYVDSHIIKGKTTKTEVQSLYGVPDENSKNSSDTTWVYRKNSGLSSVQGLAGYIPGANAVSSALGMANTAGEASSSASKMMDKSNGSTEIHGTRLYITFNNTNNIVNYWGLN